VCLTISGIHVTTVGAEVDNANAQFRVSFIQVWFDNRRLYGATYDLIYNTQHQIQAIYFITCFMIRGGQYAALELELVI